MEHLRKKKTEDRMFVMLVFPVTLNCFIPLILNETMEWKVKLYDVRLRV